MKDIKVYNNTFGWFSTSDDIGEILSRLIDRPDVEIQHERYNNKGRIKVDRESELITVKNKESNEVLLALIVDKETQRIKCIDLCGIGTDKIKIGEREYTLGEINIRFKDSITSNMICSLKNTEVNPFIVHGECNIFPADTKLVCFENCPYSNEVENTLNIEGFNNVLNYISHSNDLVSLEAK